MPKEVRSKNSRFRSQSYRKEWEKENWAQGLLKVSSQGASKAFCQFCDKNILAWKSELMRHAKTAQHCQNAAQVLGSTSMEQYVTSSQGCIKAELNTVALIARRNISFNFMSYMVPTLKHIASDSKAIKDMTSGRTKTTYLLTECLAVDAHEMLIQELQEAKGFSILCDKASDISMNKISCINVGYLYNGSPRTQLYQLIRLKRGNAEALFAALEEALVKDKLTWQQVVGYASDGENLMQGGSNSFLTRMLEKIPDIYVLKCYCHSIQLVANHACKKLSKTAEQLVQDIYNYFKNSSSRQESLKEFQHFCKTEPHKMLKMCQTRWLSLQMCTSRIVEQWKPLQLFFTAPYLRASFEFMNFVLDELTGLNRLFQSNEFQLHNLYPEVVRVMKMFALNFMKRSYIKDSHIHHLNVDDSSRWLSIQEVYPGLMASDTIKELLPHQKESFLERCREWYREAVKQLYRRINLDDPILQSLSHLKPSAIVNETSSITAAATIASGLPCITTMLNVNAQQIDRQWRSLLADENIISGQWKGNCSSTEYCSGGKNILQAELKQNQTAKQSWCKYS
ncbi:uncharacterized protein LOC143458967 isoform X2 [Clavelina lepadiformis]|uniref:uncharacterized protein LOC143458967 isoform X2 n=1 Tax=Clavelina lepadiformis TaxID=159417 RepID=UPI00404152A3